VETSDKGRRDGDGRLASADVDHDTLAGYQRYFLISVTPQLLPKNHLSCAGKLNKLPHEGLPTWDSTLKWSADGTGLRSIDTFYRRPLRAPNIDRYLRRRSHERPLASFCDCKIELANMSSATTNMSRIDEAIEVARQVVDTTPKENSNRAIRLNDLALRLGERFDSTGATCDLDEAIMAARQAVYANVIVGEFGQYGSSDSPAR